MWFELKFNELAHDEMAQVMDKLRSFALRNKPIASTLHSDRANQIYYFTTSHRLRQEVEDIGFRQVYPPADAPLLYSEWDETTLFKERDETTL